MTATNREIISTLNTLIETCKDGQNGYQNAARSVTAPDLRALLHSYAQQRERYAGELQSEVLGFGGNPKKHGSIGGPAWRAWANVKTLLSGGSEHAVIAECERGEDAARERYVAALKTKLPAHVHALIERQLAGIREAHERVRALELATTHG
jgi:uncharacterized protein (TIGR02284 family)